MMIMMIMIMICDYNHDDGDYDDCDGFDDAHRGVFEIVVYRGWLISRLTSTVEYQ